VTGNKNNIQNKNYKIRSSYSIIFLFFISTSSAIKSEHFDFDTISLVTFFINLLYNPSHLSSSFKVNRPLCAALPKLFRKKYSMHTVVLYFKTYFSKARNN